MRSRKEVEEIRKKYKPGMRVKLLNMDDVQAPTPGTEGTIKGVDDMGDILMSWDSGSSLKIILGEDKFEVIQSEL